MASHLPWRSQVAKTQLGKIVCPQRHRSMQRGRERWRSSPGHTAHPVVPLGKTWEATAGAAFAGPWQRRAEAAHCWPGGLSSHLLPALWRTLEICRCVLKHRTWRHCSHTFTRKRVLEGQSSSTCQQKPKHERICIAQSPSAPMGGRTHDQTVRDLSVVCAQAASAFQSSHLQKSAPPRRGIGSSIWRQPGPGKSWTC